MFIKSKYDRVLPTIEAIMIVLPLDTEEGSKFHSMAVRRSIVLTARACLCFLSFLLRSIAFLSFKNSPSPRASCLDAQLQHFKSMHIKNKMFQVSLRGTKFESLIPILSGPIRFYYLVSWYHRL